MAGSARSQAFGRFGYTEAPHQGGIAIDRGGFAAEYASSDRFSFRLASRVWQPESTSAYGQTLLLSGGERLPVKARLNLLGPGPEFYFASGVRLDLASTGAPYLTWSDGSAGPNIPTPDVKWVLVSFKNPQPPVLLVFLDSKASVTLSGRPGDWHILTAKPFAGWMRAVLPFGLDPVAAGGASGLGHETQRLGRSLDAWLRPAARFSFFAVKGDNDGVTASWTFDKPGALVPSAALLAHKGGYKIEILSELSWLHGETAEGPRAELAGTTLSIRFPLKRIPVGRPLAKSGSWLDAPATVSPIDIPSVVDLGLELLCPGSTAGVKKMGEDTIAAYLAEAEYVPEPATNQSLPYRPNGTGLDIAAAHALLMQALALTAKGGSDTNSLLTSLTWRRDWATWGFDSADPQVARRAAAIAAIAGACCSEPSRRLDAAMLEAGLAAQRGLALLHPSASSGAIEPLVGVRGTLFGDLPGQDAFAGSLLSPVRILGDVPVVLEKTTKGLLVVWNAADLRPITLTFVSAYSLTFENVSVKSFHVASVLNSYAVEVTPASTGENRIKVILPAWAPPLPVAATPVPYSEPVLPANPR